LDGQSYETIDTFIKRQNYAKLTEAYGKSMKEIKEEKAAVRLKAPEFYTFLIFHNDMLMRMFEESRKKVRVDLVSEKHDKVLAAAVLPPPTRTSWANFKYSSKLFMTRDQIDKLAEQEMFEEADKLKEETEKKEEHEDIA
jgi:hypothetical protein